MAEPRNDNNDRRPGTGARNGADDPVQLLENDHRAVEELFASIRDETGDRRVELIDQLHQALSVHMAIEEELVYPLVEAEVDDELAQEAEAGHDLAHDALDDVVRLSPDKPGFDGALAMLEAGIRHHVEEEEQEVLPRLRDELAEADLIDLGRKLRESREAHLSGDGATRSDAGQRRSTRTERHANGTRGRNNGSKDATGSTGSAANGAKADSHAKKNSDDDLSKAELVEQAKKAGITATSRMTKQELQEALAAAR